MQLNLNLNIILQYSKDLGGISMKNKILVILVCIIMIVTAVSVTGKKDIIKKETEEIIWTSSMEPLDINVNNPDNPYIGLEDWLHFDNGENDLALGLTNGGTFEWAARFTPAELFNFSGDQISTVKYHHDWTGEPFDMDGKVKIYEEGTLSEPGDLITSEEFTAYESDWTIIELSYPVLIEGDKDIWVSIEGTHSPGEFPAGMDPGPAVDGKGDWIYFEEYGWQELQDLGYDRNFNIWAGISPTPEIGPIPILDLENIKGGLLGISVVLRNFGEETAYDIEWEMNVSGGLLYYPTYKNGEIEVLAPEEEKTIKIKPMIGLGLATVEFYCRYTMIIEPSRDEMGGAVIQEGNDQGILFLHTFPEGKQPIKVWRTLEDHEYEYGYENGEKVVKFFLDPPEPTTMHKIHIKNTASQSIEYLTACKFQNGEAILKENWYTYEMLQGGQWEIEIVT